MEAVIANVEDHLVNPLDYKLSKGSSYITGRRSCTFFTQGGNDYSPSGVRTLKFACASDGWLDPESVRIQYKLSNTDATKVLQPLGGPAVFFRRLRVTCGGVLIHDCNEFDRLSNMMEILTTDEFDENSHIEGFGFSRYNDGEDIDNKTMLAGIPAASSRVALFRPLCGLFTQKKLLPLRYCSLIIELELVNNLTDPIVSGDVTIGGRTAVSYSGTWNMSDGQMKCDILSIDTSLENSYALHLLNGGSIPIPMENHIMLTQSLVKASEENINITRSLSRLKCMYVTFTGAKDAASDQLGPLFKNCNNFFHPCANATNALASKTFYGIADALIAAAVQRIKYQRPYDPNKELYYQIVIGSHCYPEFEVRSNAEAFYKLQQCLGIQGTKLHGVAIKDDQYFNHSFIIGQTFEKVAGSAFTGINTKMGDLCTIKLRNVSTTAQDKPDKIFMTLVGDQVMQIADIGIQVFD